MKDIALHPVPTVDQGVPGLLRCRDLWIVTAGSSASLLGDAVAGTVLVLHAHAAGWGGAGVAGIILAGSLPLVAAAPLAGRLVDQIDSRRLTVLCGAWQALCALLLGAVLARGAGGPWGVAGVLLLLAAVNAGQAVAGPAWTALLPAAVPQGAVTRALGVLQVAATVATASGAALGGMLAAGSGPASAMVLDAGTFAALALAGLAVRARRVPQRAPGAAPRAWEGAAVLARDPVLRPLVAGMVVLIAGLHLVLVARVFLIRDALGGDPAAYGVLGTGFPVGMLAGSLLAARLTGTARRARAVRIGFAVLAASVLAGGLAPSLPAFWTTQVVTGLACGVVTVLLNALVLDRVPDEVRGRALAAYLGALQACDVGGTLIGGPLTVLLRPRAVYVLAGGIGLAVSAAVGATAGARPRRRAR